MQEPNIFSNNFFKDRTRMADFLNGYIYQGEPIVLPEHILEVDPVITTLWKKGSILQAHVSVLDLARKISTEFHAVFIGIQNQTDIHYAMPVRIMSTDAAGYYGQWKAIQKENRKTHTSKNSGEFLSGFSQTDTLLPIVTIVLYYGQKPWDGAVTLKEMLNLSGCPEPLQKMIADYPINLFEIRNYPHLDRFQTDLQVVFGFLQNTNDKTQLVQYVHKHKDAFSHMKEDAYDLLCAMSNTKELKILSEQAEAQGGEYNMCKAIDDLIKDSKAEGYAKGISQGYENAASKISALNQALMRDQRQEELFQSFSDLKLQRKLLEEYHLT